MPKLSTVVDNYCMAVYELSPRTQRWYADKLTEFAQWCDGQGVDLEHLTPITTDAISPFSALGRIGTASPCPPTPYTATRR
jgi:hypothetical protein